MSKDIIEGKIREAAGRMTGNKKQKFLGKVQQKKGKLKRSVRKLKKRVRSYL